MRLAAVVLASGLSRRYGENKLLVPAEGVPLYRRAFAALPPELFDRAAVVSCYGEILRRAGELGYVPVKNPRPEEGQSASVRLGLAAVEEADGALFAVCDQPWLRRESVEELIGRWRGEPERIWALGWRGRRGNPVIFPRKYFEELKALSGDVGGGRVICAHPGETRLAEVREERELEDVDEKGRLGP